MDGKLRPCKYCGNPMELSTEHISYGMDGGCTDWRIRCRKCGCTFHYPADDFYGRRYYLEDGVIIKYNSLYDTGR